MQWWAKVRDLIIVKRIRNEYFRYETDKYMIFYNTKFKAGLNMQQMSRERKLGVLLVIRRDYLCFPFTCFSMNERLVMDFANGSL